MLGILYLFIEFVINTAYASFYPFGYIPSCLSYNVSCGSSGAYDMVQNGNHSDMIQSFIMKNRIEYTTFCRTITKLNTSYHIRIHLNKEMVITKS